MVDHTRSFPNQRELDETCDDKCRRFASTTAYTIREKPLRAIGSVACLLLLVIGILTFPLYALLRQDEMDRFLETLWLSAYVEQDSNLDFRGMVMDVEAMRADEISPGCAFTHKYRIHPAAGGLGVYVNTTYDFRNIKELDYVKEDPTFVWIIPKIRNFEPSIEAMGEGEEKAMQYRLKSQDAVATITHGSRLVETCGS